MTRETVLLAMILLIFMNACDKYIEGPGDDPVNDPDNVIQATYSSIQQNVFTPICATSGCHSGTQSPNLNAGQAYNNLVNRASLEQPSLLRVKPGDSADSFLIRKLTGNGTTMMPPTGKLDQAVIDSIIVWINNGALNN